MRRVSFQADCLSQSFLRQLFWSWYVQTRTRLPGNFGGAYSGVCPIASVISSLAWMYCSCDCRNEVFASSSRAAAVATCEPSALPC
jgi:hypothetical protein